MCFYFILFYFCLLVFLWVFVEVFNQETLISVLPGFTSPVGGNADDVFTAQLHTRVNVISVCYVWLAVLIREDSEITGYFNLKGQDLSLNYFFTSEKSP